jgi:hypothetical protein
MTSSTRWPRIDSISDSGQLNEARSAARQFNRQIFLSQAYNSGVAAFLQPNAGYLHLILRIIGAVLEPFPVAAAPVLSAVPALSWGDADPGVVGAA